MALVLSTATIADAETHKVKCGKIINPHTGEAEASTVKRWRRGDTINVPGRPEGKRWWSVRFNSNNHATFFFMSSRCGDSLSFFYMEDFRTRPSTKNVTLR